MELQKPGNSPRAVPKAYREKKFPNSELCKESVAAWTGLNERKSPKSDDCRRCA